MFPNNYCSNRALALFSLLTLVLSPGGLSDCSMLSNCNGHGQCSDSTSTCSCFEGWGASTDITFYRAPDCSARICPGNAVVHSTFAKVKKIMFFCNQLDTPGPMYRHQRPMLTHIRNAQIEGLVIDPVVYVRVLRASLVLLVIVWLARTIVAVMVHASASKIWLKCRTLCR